VLKLKFSAAANRTFPSAVAGPRAVDLVSFVRRQKLSVRLLDIVVSAASTVLR
jgi:hypothetical protein